MNTLSKAERCRREAGLVHYEATLKEMCHELGSGWAWAILHTTESGMRHKVRENEKVVQRTIDLKSHFPSLGRKTSSFPPLSQDIRHIW